MRSRMPSPSSQLSWPKHEPDDPNSSTSTKDWTSFTGTLLPEEETTPSSDVPEPDVREELLSFLLANAPRGYLFRL